MGHEHNHHHHHHHHDHDHSRSESGEMPLPEKLNKLVTHWIKHNRDHAETYRQWAAKAREGHMEDAAEKLEAVADASEKINAMLDDVLGQIGK